MNQDEIRQAVQLPIRKDDQQALFELPPDWKQHWWGMPSFEIGEARPQRQIILSFMTDSDVKAFCKATGIQATEKTISAWYPPRKNREAGRYFYKGPKTESKYPVCIPSKGRAKIQTTGRQLEQLGVTHRFFVEDHEYNEYVAELGEKRVVRMPFSNLGQGSISARNFIWDWAKSNGHARHWCLDDNILRFGRTNFNQRFIVKGGSLFAAVEDFADRFTNCHLAGMNYSQFAKACVGSLPPFYQNTRIYSCILIDTSLPFRWRGRYNEDTDLSLRVLKAGGCTALFNSLVIWKAPTAGAKNSKPLAGGNTDNVYNTGDHRLAFSESLEKQHPDVVEVVWKFGRWHHQVDYLPFKRNRLIYRDGVTRTANENEYGMRLTESQDDDWEEDD